jgi:hypothetical protein
MAFQARAPPPSSEADMSRILSELKDGLFSSFWRLVRKRVSRETRSTLASPSSPWQEGQPGFRLNNRHRSSCEIVIPFAPNPP